MNMKLRRAVALSVAVLLLLQTGAARESSESSGWISPDSFLYPLKIGLEKFSLNLVFNQTEKAQKMVDLAEERLKEVESMEKENNSKAFKNAMDEYADQLKDLQSVVVKADASGVNVNIQTNITEKIENQQKRTAALESEGDGISVSNVSIIQQSIIKASSSSGNGRVQVSVVNGNVSVYTEGGNATVTRDGNNVTVVSVSNNSVQQVVVKSSQGTSSSSAIAIASSSSSSVTSENSNVVYVNPGSVSFNTSGISINSSGVSANVNAGGVSVNVSGDQGKGD